MVVNWFWESYTTFQVMQICLKSSKTDPNIGIGFLSTHPKSVSFQSDYFRFMLCSFGVKVVLGKLHHFPDHPN